MSRAVAGTAAGGETPAGHRRCALALHALHPEDRAWMLGELGASMAATLAGLLAELDELGIPPDPALVKQVLARPHEAGEAPPASWAQALASEPPGLLALALRDRPARQRQAILEAFDAAKARQANQRQLEHASAPDRAPRLKQAVDIAVGEALRARTSRAPTPWWVRAWEGLRGMRA